MGKLDNLTVLNFPLGKAQADTQWDNKKNLFLASSCARQVLVGTPEQFADLPAEIARQAEVNRARPKPNLRNDIVLETGKKAYEMLLRITCGLASEKKGEEHILGQIRTAWTNFQDQCHTTAKALEGFMQKLFQDAKKIRRDFLNKLGPSSQAIAAREIAKPTGTESVLLIAGKDGITADLAKALARKHKVKVERITVSHPDQKILDDRFGSLIYEKMSNGKINASLEKLAFGALKSRKIEEYDHVFICQAMDGSENDQAIRELCEASKPKGRILHLSGDPKSRGSCSEEWLKLQSMKFIKPEEIRIAHEANSEMNRMLLQAAELACTRCAIDRDSGSVPQTAVLKALKVEPEPEVAKL